MNERNGNELRATGPDVSVAPEAGTDRPGGERAREQFVHGLLGFLHHDGPPTQEERIRRVMAAIEREQAAAKSVVIGRIGWRRWSGLAAAMLMVVGVLAILIPTEQSATATVQSSLRALQSGGDRRYEVRVMLPRQQELEKEPMATVDVRDGSHMLVEAKGPGGHVTLGLDEKGKWIIRPDGTLDRFPPRQAWPRWLDMGENTVLLESVDTQLEAVLKEYTLERSEAAKLPGTAEGSATYARVTAKRKSPSPEPERIELWLEKDTRLLKRMELHWAERPWEGQPPRGPNQGDRNQGPGPRQAGRAREPGALAPGAEGDDGARPGPRPQGGEDDMDGSPPPEGEDGPRFGPPPGPERRRPGGPPLGPGGRRPPPRDGGDRGPEQGPPPPGQGPGPLGRLLGGGRPPMDDGDGPHPPPPPHPPRPRFLDGPPEFGGGRHPPPPRMIVFERVDAPKFADGWFSPEAHQKE